MWFTYPVNLTCILVLPESETVSRILSLRCCNDIIRTLSLNIQWYDVLFSNSQVLWLRDLLWLLDDVTRETEA